MKIHLFGSGAPTISANRRILYWDETNHDMYVNRDGGTTWDKIVAGGGGGEVNTGSNVGAFGVGPFDAKVGVDLQFRKLDGISGITTALNGQKVDVAPTYGSCANTVCQGNDSRLSDARTPTAHAASHKSGGSDAIKLDELAAPTDVTTLNSTTTEHGLLPKLGGGTSNFLRADGTWAAPTASVAGTTVEVNLGSTPKWSGKFTITDAAIGASSKVLCWQAPGPYTGKGTRADEAEMQPVSVIAVEPASGSAVVKWQTPPMVAYSALETRGGAGIAGVYTTWGQNRQPQVEARRIGKIRGNVKFTYLVIA